MKALIEEAALIAVYVIIGAALIGAAIMFTITDNTSIEQLPEEHVVTSVNPRFTECAPPLLEVDPMIYVRKGDTFNPLAFVTKAEDSTGGDLKSRIQIYTRSGEYVPESIDTSLVGNYRIRYAVQDSSGLWAWSESVVEVRE